MVNSTFLCAFARTGFSDNYSDAEAIRSSPINLALQTTGLRSLQGLQRTRPAPLTPLGEETKQR